MDNVELLQFVISTLEKVKKQADYALEEYGIQQSIDQVEKIMEQLKEEENV